MMTRLAISLAATCLTLLTGWAVVSASQTVHDAPKALPVPAIHDAPIIKPIDNGDNFVRLKDDLQDSRNEIAAIRAEMQQKPMCQPCQP